MLAILFMNEAFLPKGMGELELSLIGSQNLNVSAVDSSLHSNPRRNVIYTQYSASYGRSQWYIDYFYILIFSRYNE